MAGFNLRNTVDGIVDYKRKWDNAKATGKDTSEFEKGAAAYYKELRDNGRGDVADYLQKSDSITAGEYLKQLQPEYGVDAASLQKKSDTLFNEGIRDKNQLNADFDKVYDNNINVDPTSTGYGKNILSGYGIAADEAYKGTLGGNAEDNGGNVDSFAAANANRQKAAILSQGYGDVLGYYNAIAGQANQWATNKGNTVGAYLAQLQGNVDADRDVTKKAFEGTVDLWKAQYANKTEKEIAELGADVTREQMAQEKVIADEANMTELLVQQMKNDAKSGSGNVADSPQFNARSVVDNIINRHTKGTYAVVEDDGVTKKYEKDGKTTDFEAVAVDLQAMIDDESIPYARRVAIFNEAKLEGIGVLAPVAEGTVRPEEIKDNRILSHFASLPNNDERLIHLNGLVADKTLSPGQGQWLINKYGIII